MTVRNCHYYENFIIIMKVYELHTSFLENPIQQKMVSYSHQSLDLTA